MPSKVENELKDLAPIFKRELINHLRDVQKDASIYGYAVLLGEDIDQCNAIAVTNSEADIGEHIGTDAEPEYRYFPDEWKHWHNDAFPEFNAALDAVYEKFRSQCPEDESFEYNQDELEYFGDIYNLYLSVLMDCRNQGEFESVWYRIIWISDSDRPIISESFVQLNEGRPIIEAQKFFNN